MALPYTKEQLAQANGVNLIDYAAMNGYMLENGGSRSLHVKSSGGLYLFKESNKFYHHATGKMGGPIDFVMQFEGKAFLEAVGHLIRAHPEIGGYVPPPARSAAAEKVRAELALPDRAPNVKRVYWYLCTVRGIDSKIVSRLIKEKKIYQQAGYGNCVFVGFDEKNVPRYCCRLPN